MEIKININHVGNETFVIPVGSITSSNATEFSEAVKGEPVGDGGITVDAADLEYISSAGLRVILMMKKSCGKKSFRVINANSEVMNVFDVTGFSEMMDIFPATKKISVDGCKKIGAGACGECYRIDDERIIKLYYKNVSDETIENEKALAKKAFVLGIPTAISYDIVEADGRKGVVYELIKSKTLTELFRDEPENFEANVKMYAETCRNICSIETDDPLLPSFKEVNRLDIDKVPNLTDEEKSYLNRFLDMIPNKSYCIHGDLNPNNVMVQNGECCLIDMGEFSKGHPLFDVSRILFSMEYAVGDSGEMSDFYKISNDTVRKIWKLFFKYFFGCETIEEAIAKDPDVELLYPLAWFRCCTSMLKGKHYPPEKVEYARKIFHEKLIPYIDSHS